MMWTPWMLAWAVLLLSVGAAEAAAPLELPSTGIDVVDGTVESTGRAAEGVVGQTRQIVAPQAPSEGTPSAPAPTGRTEAVRTAAAVTGTALIGVGLLGQLSPLLRGILPTALYTRLRKETLLDQVVRGRIHEAVEHNPGITAKELTRMLDVGWGTVVHHLRLLESEGLLVSERHRQFRRYFRNGGGIVNEGKKAYSELLSPTSQALAARVRQQPGVGQSELCQAVGISAPLGCKYLARLEAVSLVERRRDQRQLRVYPTARLEEILARSPELGGPRLQPVLVALERPTVAVSA